LKEVFSLVYEVDDAKKNLNRLLMSCYIQWKQIYSHAHIHFSWSEKYKHLRY